MRVIRFLCRIAILGGLAILSLTGCDAGIKDAAKAGLADFVTASVAGILASFIPT